jgi:putative hydrolase of HD superfamily
MPDASPDPVPSAAAERLRRQLDFVVEIDRLKGVLRRTPLVDNSRRENSAEHSWHLATMALVLGEYAGDGVDAARAARMVLVHDVVEIDAGDTFAYDAAANVGKEAREQLAARRLFGMLPDDQAAELRGLWEEFEAEETPDARFAVALDRLQPLLVNHAAGGGSWRDHQVTREQVLTRMRPIEHGLPSLWPAVVAIVDESCRRGHIRDAGTGA